MTTGNITSHYLFKNLTAFDGFEIHGVQELFESSTSQEPYACEQCGDDEADFFSLYGHYDPTDFNNGVPYANVGLECLLDFTTRHEAETALKYFTAFRQLMLDARKTVDQYNRLLEDEDVSTATDAIESIMEEMEALEVSLLSAEDYGRG